jgi:RHS repeat-associated protein
VAYGITIAYSRDIYRGLPVVVSDGARQHVYGQGLAYAVDSSNHAFVDHTDGLGSVREVTSGSGVIVATDQTDAFGNPLTTGGAFRQPFQFTGQQADPTGLYNLRARLYDPNTGRFMQQDPLFGNLANPLTLNRYTYVENNPTTRTDPAGLCDTGVVGDPGCNGSDLSAGSPMIGPLSEEPSPAPDTDPGHASVGNEAISLVSQASYRLFGGPLRSIWASLRAFAADESGEVGWGRSSAAGQRQLPFSDPSLLTEVNVTLDAIEAGGPFAYSKDGTVWQNKDGDLPVEPPGYYREYTVATPGSATRGARRIVQGLGGETYYTNDHDRTFIQIDPGRY